MKKSFATLLTLTLLVGAMTTTAFAAETVNDGCLSISNVAESTEVNGWIGYTCDDYATITITEDIFWINIYYLDSAGSYQPLAMNTVYGDDSLPVFDCSHVTVVVTETDTAYTMLTYLDAVEAGEVEWEADAYITAGSSFDILLGYNYYAFQTVSLELETQMREVFAAYEVATVTEPEEEVVVEEAEEITEEVVDDALFSDVTEDDAFYDAVLWAVDAGVTAGYDDGTFRPSDTCTRGEVVTFLYRAAGEPDITTTENPFSDVSEDSPYYTAILWAVENGITTGYSDGTFRPDDTCSNAQVVTFLHRGVGAPEADFESELTADVADAYVGAINWADAITLLDGMDFVADDAAPQSDIVTYLYLIANTVEMA